MLRNISQLDCKVGEKLYSLLCDQDSPLEHVKGALFEFLKYIGKVEDAMKLTVEAVDKPKENEKVVELPKEEN